MAAEPSAMADAYVGTSGWSYEKWAGTFYPDDLPRSQSFAYYSDHFNSVEVNATFYGRPRAKVTAKWAEQAPPGFAYFLKGSNYLTHRLRLKRPAEPIDNVLRPTKPLGDHLHGFLWQLPPNFGKDLDRLTHFLDLLEGHDDGRGLRHAVEFRHATWFDDDVYDAMRDHDAGIVIADWPLQVLAPGMGARDVAADRDVKRVPLTARDWVFVRRHGPQEVTASKYTAGQVRTDAEQMRSWLDDGRDVYAYYNNDNHGYAPENAQQLARLVHAVPVPA